MRVTCRAVDGRALRDEGLRVWHQSDTAALCTHPHTRPTPTHIWASKKRRATGCSGTRFTHFRLHLGTTLRAGAVHRTAGSRAALPGAKLTVDTPSTNLVRKMTLALLNIPSLSDTTMNCGPREGCASKAPGKAHGPRPIDGLPNVRAVSASCDVSRPRWAPPVHPPAAVHGAAKAPLARRRACLPA